MIQPSPIAMFVNDYDRWSRSISNANRRRAQLVRDHLTLEIRSVRSLLSALMILPWEATPGHPVLAAIQLLRALYEHDARELPTTTAIR